MQNTDPIQTCTTVYGEINVNSGAATITLAVAGHPPPMIVRTDAGVEATTARGTMLGAIPQPSFETCQVSRGPGDTVVVCSDGCAIARSRASAATSLAPAARSRRSAAALVRGRFTFVPGVHLRAVHGRNVHPERDVTVGDPERAGWGQLLPRGHPGPGGEKRTRV